MAAPEFVEGLLAEAEDHQELGFDHKPVGEGSEGTEGEDVVDGVLDEGAFGGRFEGMAKVP